MRDSEVVSMIVQWLIFGLLFGLGISFITFCITIGFKAALEFLTIFLN